MILFPYILIQVLLESWSEALHDKGGKKQSKLIQSIWIASWFMLPVIVHASSWIYLLIPGSYAVLRAGVFDVVYNAVFGHEFNYQSHTTYVWDRIINKIKPHKALYTVFIFVCIFLSFFLLNWIKN